jgi:hypothetical protein
MNYFVVMYLTYANSEYAVVHLLVVPPNIPLPPTLAKSARMFHARNVLEASPQTSKIG